jgi:phosphoglycolate phosphatase
VETNDDTSATVRVRETAGSKMGTKRLLLWDIDGTLINSGAAGHHAISRATAERCGGNGDLDGVEIAGRTDTSIARQVLEKYGEPVTDESVNSFLNLYVELLAEELPARPGRVLPGVLELLQRSASQPHSTLGLLTGNLERGARLKLEHYRIWHFFGFGAFADDHQDRNQLGAFARSRALEGTGIDFPASQVDVIGDTGHDIACGKAIGARTVAVATGSWSKERLASYHPDFLFDDLSNVDEVIKTLAW